MEPDTSAELSSIAERMSRLRMRMYLEKVSGIAVSEKEEFLAYCRVQEGPTDADEGRLESFLMLRRDELSFSRQFFEDINPPNRKSIVEFIQ